MNRASLTSRGIVGLGLALGLGAGPAMAQTYAIVHSFTGGADGGYPSSNVVQDAAGNLYTAANAGGAGGCNFGGPLTCGTLVKINSSGTLTTLVTFHTATGGSPLAIALVGTTIYGTLNIGGPDNDGSIYSVGTNGANFTVLHSFSGLDGEYPATLVVNPQGALYGLAERGGSGGGGTLFQVLPDGTFTLLHSFINSTTDGEFPNALLISRSGVLYGSTQEGGLYQNGTVFSYAPATAQFAILANFSEAAGHRKQGYYPYLGSIAPNGVLYGAAEYGGVGYGTIFQVSPTNNGYTTKVLYSFTNSADGGEPVSGPVVQSSTSLVGASSFSLYSFSQSGIVVLHTFGGTPGDGDILDAAPLVGISGTLYGTTSSGGASNKGTVYSYQP